MFTKSLSRIALVSGLILGASTIVPTVALAQTAATGELSGTITPAQTITWGGTLTGIAITPNSATPLALGFGTVSATTNVTWEINANSANASKLKNGTVEIPYTFGIADGVAAQTLLVTDLKVYDGGVDSSAGITTKAVTLNILAADTVGKKAGNYIDTVTLTITPKL